MRGPGTSARALFQITRELSSVAGGSQLTVNDRVDVALALGLTAVHLGQRSMPVREARRLIGREGRIGVSVHGRQEAESSHAVGADYVMAGHVFATPSHDTPPAGLRLVRELGKPGRPVVAVGGISPARVGVLLEAGAHGVAVLRGVWQASDPVSALLDFLQCFSDVRSDDY